MNSNALHDLLFATWADPADEVARAINMADPTLPTLVGNVEISECARCAEILLALVARKSPRGLKEYTVSLRGTDVVLQRGDDEPAPGTYVARVTRRTEVETLAQALRIKRAADRKALPETAGWEIGKHAD